MRRTIVGLLVLMVLALTAAPAAAEVDRVVIKVAGALNCVF